LTKRSAYVPLLCELRHAVNLAVEVAGDAVPGLDTIAGAATSAELATIADEYTALKRDTDAAIKFVQNGPYSLEDLRVSPTDEGFFSFSASTLRSCR
jgi:hypothetical protein